MKKRVLLGMSGGVDSAAAAKILTEKGYEVSGATFIFFIPETSDYPGQAAEDAAEICRKLGIRHYIFDMRRDFSKTVIEPFIESYISGETPNPCIDCNRTAKIPGLFQKADELGFEYAATGHYAKTDVCKTSGRNLLLCGSDKKKDQSYVLYNLTQNELGRILFPLGDLKKDEVRLIAAQAGFTKVVEKAESQDICFIPDGDYVNFINRRCPGKIQPGNFISQDGTVIGKHKGVPCYTIGQRRGIACAFGKPFYVTAKNPAANTVTLGEEAGLFSGELTAEKINLISIPEIIPGMEASVKTRYSQRSAPARLYPEDGGVRVIFDEPQRALTTGQSAVFYDGKKVIGGGVITCVSAK